MRRAGRHTAPFHRPVARRLLRATAPVVGTLGLVVLVQILAPASRAAGSFYSPAEIAAALDVAAGVEDFVTQVSDDAFGGRDNATADSLAVQAYLISELVPIADGLDAQQMGDDAYKQPFSLAVVDGTNVLGVIPGRELPDEYVALRALPVPPRRSVVLALWDAEEDGLVGSEAYTLAPLVPLASTVAYVNFDIQGANLLPSLRDKSFAVGAESGGARLTLIVEDAIASHGLDTRLLSSVFGQGRSDYVNFLLEGIPTIHFSDSTGGCYHTTGDEIGVVDLAKLAGQSRTAFRVVLALAEEDPVPVFDMGTPLATFDDAVHIAGVLNAGEMDLGLFAPGDQATLLGIQTTLNDIVAAGPAAFDGAAVADLLVSAASAVNLLTNLECDGFLVPEPRRHAARAGRVRDRALAAAPLGAPAPGRGATPVGARPKSRAPRAGGLCPPIAR